MSLIPYDYLKILLVAESISPTDKERLHTCRMQCEPFVFEALKNRYGQKLDMHFNTCTIPRVSDKALVIVERRCHANLEFCIKNAVYFNPGFALHIYCSKANAGFVKLICGKHIESVHIHVIMDTIGTALEGREEYNKLLKTKKFWEDLAEEHIIVFETDSYFLRQIPPSIFTYDYVASKWPWIIDAPGGGGLSYRKRSVMLKICDHYNQPTAIMQDSFVSEGIKTLGYKYPDEKESAKYFTESYFSSCPVGTHQWWTFLLNINTEKKLQIIDIYLKLDIN